MKRTIFNGSEENMSWQISFYPLYSVVRCIGELKVSVMSLPSDLHQYENLKETVSRLLDKQHCEKLAVFFDLTPSETDIFQKDFKTWNGSNKNIR